MNVGFGTALALEDRPMLFVVPRYLYSMPKESVALQIRLPLQTNRFRRMIDESHEAGAEQCRGWKREQSEHTRVVEGLPSCRCGGLSFRHGRDPRRTYAASILGEKVDLAHRTLVMMRQGKYPPPKNHGEYIYKSPAAPTSPSASLGCA